jgi:putative transposase
METLLTKYSISELAEALEVAPSGFHAHRHKTSRLRRRQDAELQRLLTDAFAQSRCTYGSPRLQIELRAAGYRCGKNRVARLMRQAGLRAKQKRRYRPVTTDSRHDHRIARNWPARVPASHAPGQIWQSDISYIETKEGWLYFAFTIDSCSRKIVGHHCRADLAAELTIATLRGALRRQRPPDGLIHHSDRGSQYAGSAFREQLTAHRITASMSRSGNPYDNALAESFVATLKTECFGEFIPLAKEHARLMIFDYIESFYNRRRRHSALAYRSPLQFEQDFATTQREGCSGDGSQGGETSINKVGSSRPGCEQLRDQRRGVVQIAGNNPVELPKNSRHEIKQLN